MEVHVHQRLSMAIMYRQSQSEKKKIQNCGVLPLKMAQRAHGHMQPILFLLKDMDQNEIVLNKIWVFIRLYW